MNVQDNLLTVNEVAEEFRLSLHTIRSWVSQNKITYQKIGRRVRFKRSVIKAFIESNTMNLCNPKG